MGIFSLRNSTLSILFIAAIALSAWSIILSKQTHNVVAHSDIHQPDAYMENAIAIIMNKSGKPSLKIAAPKMIHYAENDVTYVTHPDVTVYRQSPEPWYINADTAETLNGTDRIIFNDHVVIHHPTDSENPKTIMLTNSLTIFPAKQQAETDKPVIITQPDTTIHAIGMLADLNDGTIKLLSEAKGDYVPHS